VEQQPEMQLPLQQICPFLHWLSVEQPQAAALQLWVPTSQHSPATQSVSAQQLPGMQ
jgi:hypothetical protein